MEKPELIDGHGRIANEIMDVMACTYMSSYESQFIWFLFRKTYGWNKKDDYISLSQIELGTGIKRSHVCRTKKKLLQRKIITQMGNKIAFNKYHSQWLRLPKQVTERGGPQTGNGGVPKQVMGSPHLGNGGVPKQAHTKDTITKDIYTKDTITKESSSETEHTPRSKNESFFINDLIQQETVNYFVSQGADRSLVDSEVKKFVDYWTEPNKSGTKVRWQMQKTFDVKRRLITWLNNSRKYSTSIRSHSTPQI